MRYNLRKGGNEMSETDGNVHTMPNYGPDHVESVTCWCEPILMDDFTDQGGCKHYLHKEHQ